MTDLHVVVLQHGQDFLRRASENLSRQVPKLGPHQVQQGLIRCPSLLRGWPIRPSSVQIKHRGLQATPPCQRKSRETLTVTCRTCFHIETELHIASLQNYLPPLGRIYVWVLPCQNSIPPASHNRHCFTTRRELRALQLCAK